MYDDILPILIAKLKSNDHRFKRSYLLYECIGNYKSRAEPHLDYLVDLDIQAAAIVEVLIEILKEQPRITGNYYLKRTLSAIQRVNAKQP